MSILVTILLLVGIIAIFFMGLVIKSITSFHKDADDVELMIAKGEDMGRVQKAIKGLKRKAFGNGTRHRMKLIKKMFVMRYGYFSITDEE